MNIMEYPQDATQDIDSQSILLSATSDDGKGQGQHVFHLLVGQDQGSDQLNPIGLGNLSADDVADVFRGLDMSSLGVTSAWDTRDIFSHGNGPGGDVFHARQKKFRVLEYVCN